MGWDKLSDGGDVKFFFLGSRDDNVGIRGVSSSFTSEFELRIWCFVFIRSSIYRSPVTSVLGSFFVKYARSVSGGCWSLKCKLVFLLVGAPPLQIFEVEVNWD